MLKKAAESVAMQVYRKADVVFITDGHAPIDPKFLVDFLDLKKKREFRVLGVPIQTRDISALKEFSDQIVQVDELLDVEAEGLMKI